MALPGDIVFAQKASACVKAAGLDPRSMDLRKFRNMAVTIFTRAYQGIYKEYDGIISDPLNADEQASNAQKVINGLLKKTGNEALVDITGQDVVTGSHKAIGILVGVLYGEGNRLWMEKLEKMQRGDRTTDEHEHTGQTIINDDYDDNDVPKKKKTTKKIKKRRKKQANDSEDVPESDGQDDPQAAIFTGGDREECTQQIQEDYRAIAMAQMGGIRRKRPKSAPSTRIASSQRAICDRLLKANGKPPRQIIETLTEQVHSKPWLPPNPDPSSQPSSPNVKQQSNNDEKYSSFPPVAQSDHSFPSEPHTYDPISGRKITIAEYQLKMAELVKKRKQDAVGNLKNASDHFGENGDNDNYRRIMNDQNLPPVPTKPVWPGPSTGKSVEKFVKRMLVARVGEEIVDPNSQPKYYQAYNLLGAGDLVISIEHCYNCEHHCATLRHDALEYVRKADHMLRTLAQIAHDCGICARVGVIRVRSRISTKSKSTDAGSRIGAFEVQIACNNMAIDQSRPAKGGSDMQVELLHSKLVTRRWPSKSVIEKRLRAFISQCRLSSQAVFDGSNSNGYGSDGIGGNYPIGNAMWEDTPLADESWKFPEFCEPSKGAAKAVAAPSPKELLAAAVANATTTTPGETDTQQQASAEDATMGNHTGEGRGLHVQWVYDAREIVGAVKGGQNHRFSGTAATATPQSLPTQPPSQSRARPKSASSAPSSSSNGGNSKVAASSSSSHSNMVGEQRNKTTGSKQETMTSPPSTVTENESVLEHLQRIAAEQNMGTTAYDNPVVLVKKGVIFAETIASCQLIRQVVRQYRFSIDNTTSSNTLASLTHEEERLRLSPTDTVMQILFDVLDRRHVGKLSIADLDEFLQSLLGRKCTSEAFRLIVLSFDTNGDGEISPEEFSAFFTRELPITPDNDADELGVIWARLRSANANNGTQSSTVAPQKLSPRNDIVDELQIGFQKLQQVSGQSNGSASTCLTFQEAENLFETCGLSDYMGGRGSQCMNLFLRAFGDASQFDMEVFMMWLNGDCVVGLGRDDHEDDDEGDLAVSEKVMAVASQPLSVVDKVTGLGAGDKVIGPGAGDKGTGLGAGDKVAGLGAGSINHDFEARELVIKSVRLRGSGLKKHVNDFVHVNLIFSMSQHTREVLLYVPAMTVVPSSSAKTAGSTGTVMTAVEERNMSVDWSPILVTKQEFEDGMNHAGLTVSYTPASSTPGSQVTVLVPFTQFYVEKDTTFDVTIPITLSSNGGGNTTGGTGGGGAAATGPSTNADDEVIIILSGTAYESSESKANRIHKMTVEQLATIVFAPLDESADSPPRSAKKGDGENSTEVSPKKEVTFLANGTKADSLYGAFERFDDDEDDDERVAGLIDSASSAIKPPVVAPTTTTTTTSTAAVIETPIKTPSKSAPSNTSAASTTPTPVPVTGPPITIETPGPDYEADFDGSDVDEEEGGGDDLIVDDEEIIRPRK